MQKDMKQEVQQYYANTLQTNKDLKTSACCDPNSLPKYQLVILKNIHQEIKEKFYGCGSPIPFVLEGKTIVDLGCGSGRDVYLMSKLVGQNGKIIGVDMTPEQLAIAQKHLSAQMQAFDFTEPNVSFVKSEIEDLSFIADNSVDIITSNCVINLSTNKEKVFQEIFRILKEGGELHFADIFTDRRVPENLKQDPVLYGECLSGALYIEDFRRILRKVGCLDYRIIAKRQIEITKPQIKEKVGNIKFYSITIRAFKLSCLEDLCEDYGQVATYNGGIANSEHLFILDDHHIFEKGRPMLVCSNTAVMLAQTRFAPFFTISGDTSTHFGLFDCSPSPSSSSNDNSGGCC